MTYVHRCTYCGWQRPAASTVMLAPLCESCGCALEATTVERPEERPPRRAFAPAIPPRALALGFALLLIAAALRAGYVAGGPSIAVTTGALMLFALLPFFRR